MHLVWPDYPSIPVYFADRAQLVLLTCTVACYIAESSISDSAFPYWQKKDRKAKRRHPQLLAELQTLAASVVCLQNVEADFFQTMLKPEMGMLGYEGEHMKLPGKSAAKIGVATFWHTRTFRLLKVAPLNASPARVLQSRRSWTFASLHCSHSTD